MNLPSKLLLNWSDFIWIQDLLAVILALLVLLPGTAILVMSRAMINIHRRHAAHKAGRK